MVGQFFGNEVSMTPELARTYVRHYMVDQLTYDPQMGTSNLLSADGPVVLAWDSSDLLAVEIAGQKPRHLGNVLYYLPARLAIHGTTTFRADLLRSTVIQADAILFSKDPASINFGRGTVTMAYRPVGFDGRIAATELAIGLNAGDSGLTVPPEPVKPLASIPPACDQFAPKDCTPEVFDGLAEVEVFDIEAGAWMRLPHLRNGTRYAVESPARYVDPTSGTVLVRFVNEVNDGVGFAVDLSISGDVE